MFTLKQIEDVHAKVATGADFLQYVQNMKHLGVVAYDLYVVDGHARYLGLDQVVLSEPAYPQHDIAARGDQQALQQALTMHQAGRTDYPTFCRQAAQAGVERWTIRTGELTCTYYDRQDQILVVEDIPLP